MDPERWNQVDRLLQSALERPGGGARRLSAPRLRQAAAHRYAEAAAEFRKILDHPGIVGLDPIGALAHLQLGRTLALLGDTAGAKAAYRDFLARWKNADSDVLILQQGMAEYARLP